MTQEYKIEIRVKNNLIIQKLSKQGVILGSKGGTSFALWCKERNISYSSIIGIINLKESPLRTIDGKFKTSVIKFCDALLCSPDEIFTDQQKHCKGITRREVLISEAEAKSYLEHVEGDQYLLPLEEQVDRYNLENKVLDDVLNTLTPREKSVLIMRFKENKTLKEVGILFGVQSERIRQIEVKALRKLRHPSKCDLLRDFL